jgi:hypothetical protein
MAVKRPIVNVGGRLKELPNTDTIFGVSSVAATTVDFGLSGVRDKTFDVAVAGALTGQICIAALSGETPPGVAKDEISMTPLDCSAYVSATGIVRLHASSRLSRITRQRIFNILLR